MYIFIKYIFNIIFKRILYTVKLLLHILWFYIEKKFDILSLEKNKDQHFDETLDLVRHVNVRYIKFGQLLFICITE